MSFKKQQKDIYEEEESSFWGDFMTSLGLKEEEELQTPPLNFNHDLYEMSQTGGFLSSIVGRF